MSETSAGAAIIRFPAPHCGLMEKVGRTIADFRDSNPALYQLFLYILDEDHKISKKSEIMACLLEIAERINLPTREEAAFHFAMKRLRSQGLDLYVEEMRLFVNKWGAETGLALAGMIMASISGKPDRDAARKYLGLILMMKRLAKN